MTETLATIALVLILCLGAALVLFVRSVSGSLGQFDPIDDDEARLLTLVDESLYVPLLRYLRTLEMSAELQEFLSDNKQCLEAISYYMLLKSSQEEELKKGSWDGEALALGSTNDYSRKMIARRLKNSPMLRDDV